jgi:hypothetical protein
MKDNVVSSVVGIQMMMMMMQKGGAVERDLSSKWPFERISISRRHPECLIRACIRDTPLATFPR